MDTGRLEQDTAKDELTWWREEKALPRRSLLEDWDRHDAAYPGLARAARHISVCRASAAIVERMFSSARDALPYNVGVSDRETMSKRFCLHVNRAAAVALIRTGPEMRPVIRIATGVASLHSCESVIQSQQVIDTTGAWGAEQALHGDVHVG
jgi:hypothetical protein